MEEGIIYGQQLQIKIFELQKKVNIHRTIHSLFYASNNCHVDYVKWYQMTFELGVPRDRANGVKLFLIGQL